MFRVKPLFSRRIHLLLKVTPAAWLVSACFLGGDYFTDRNQTSSETAASSDTTATSEPTSSSAVSSNLAVPPGPSSTTSASEEVQTSETPSDTTVIDGARDGGLSNNEGVSDSYSSEVNTTTTPELSSSATSNLADTSSSDGGNTDESSEPCYGFRCEEECNPDEVAGPNGGCFWFSRTQMSWTSAQTTCASRGPGWSVVTLHTQAEDTFVEEHIETDTWIGAQYTGGSWRWVDDDAAFPDNNAAGGDDAHANWGTNEPSGAKGENCARYHSYNSVWRWGDSKCNELFAVACRGPGPGEEPMQ